MYVCMYVCMYVKIGSTLHGNMYEDRGEMVSTFIVCFALSSAICGYSSGSFYKYRIQSYFFLVYS
jgi:hypothetical protein